MTAGVRRTVGAGGVPSRPRRTMLSTRARMLAVILVVTAISLIASGGVAFTMQYNQALSRVDEHLLSHADALLENATDDPDATASGAAEVVSGSLDPSSFTSVESLLRAELSRIVGHSEAAIGIIDGDVALRSAGALSAAMAADTEFVASATAISTRTDSAAIGTAELGGTTVRWVSVPVSVEGDATTGVSIRAINLDETLDPLHLAALVFCAVALVILVVVGLITWAVLGRWLLSPMQHLQRTTGEISLSHLAARVPEGGTDDLANVGRSVNAMLDRLEGSVDVQRRLLDDVRHELKTPITIVRGHLEMMNPADPADVASAREIAISELDRMTRLVEDIDLLATVEDDEYTMGMVDVSRLTARIGEMIVAIPGHPWRVLDRADTIVRGNPDRLLQAWLALIDNAAKYTPQGSPIELGSTLTTDEVHLWVRDHGVGIPPAMRHRIFRRFDRGSGRRDVGGTGLGLAIVDAIARAHGGSCTVTDTPGGGATFVIRVPAHLGRPGSNLPQPIRAGTVALREDTV